MASASQSRQPVRWVPFRQLMLNGTSDKTLPLLASANNLGKLKVAADARCMDADPKHHVHEA